MAEITEFKEHFPSVLRLGKIVIGVICLTLLILAAASIGLMVNQMGLSRQILTSQSQLNDYMVAAAEDSEHEHAVLGNPYDDLYPVASYCESNVTHYKINLTNSQLCFLIQYRVENITHMDNKTVIYEYLESLEPQAGPDLYWAVLKPTTNPAKRSIAVSKRHRETEVKRRIEDGGSAAKRHRETGNAAKRHYLQIVSTVMDPPNGWGLLFWRIQNVGYYGITYCQSTPENADPHDPSNVCGGFALSEFPVDGMI